ncbi:MAG: hypothetical protein IIA06_00745 [Proteobacteria bacterium]|nr:hypothetical protein [Pseudomonadota bacterium]
MRINDRQKQFSIEGSRRPRHRGTLFLGYFLWGEQQEVTRHRGEIETKKNDDINYWILAFASMTKRRGWIPVCTGMTVVDWVAL